MNADDELDERKQAVDSVDALAEGPPGFAETADDLEPLPPGALADTADEIEPLEPQGSGASDAGGESAGLVALVVVLGLIVVLGLVGIALLSA